MTRIPAHQSRALSSMAEQNTHNVLVVGSSPTEPTSFFSPAEIICKKIKASLQNNLLLPLPRGNNIANQYLKYFGFNNIGRFGLWAHKIDEGCYEIVN